MRIAGGNGAIGAPLGCVRGHGAIIFLEMLGTWIERKVSNWEESSSV